MKKFYTILIALLMVSSVMAQSAQPCSTCLPEGKMFASQTQIDNFQINYPGCTEIVGDVKIYGPYITNLNGLNILTSIGGSLEIGSVSTLTSLTGLDRLISIGGTLDIGNNFGGNPALTILTGLDNLTSIGDGISIKDNAVLTSLIGLGNLNSVGGSVNIADNASLTSLTGLNNLISIGGGLGIYVNEALISLTGLEGLTSIGGTLDIGGNYALISLMGLEGLTNIGGEVLISNNITLSTCDAQLLCDYLANPNGIISIHNNAAGCNSVIELANACGGSMPCLPYGNYYFVSQSDIDNFQTAFLNCTVLQGNVSIFGSDITNLNGLNIVTSIGGGLDVSYNSVLTSLTGLDNLASIGDFLSIYSNDVLTSLTGLNNLTSIGGSLYIYQNSVLTSLTGLEGLTSIWGSLEIGGFEFGGNPALTSLSGLDNIVEGSINNLIIVGNYSLSNCAVQSVCDYLASPNPYGVVYIGNNALGCNSVEEVEAACSVGLDESAVSSRQSAMNIYPNPASDQITIETPTPPYKNTFMTIYNINGQALLSRQITERQTVVDVSGLNAGIYFVKMISDDGVMVGKFVKQ